MFTTDLTLTPPTRTSDSVDGNSLILQVTEHNKLHIIGKLQKLEDVFTHHEAFGTLAGSVESTLTALSYEPLKTMVLHRLESNIVDKLVQSVTDRKPFYPDCVPSFSYDLTGFLRTRLKY